jgi:hypothetical protein
LAAPALASVHAFVHLRKSNKNGRGLCLTCVLRNGCGPRFCQKIIGSTTLACHISSDCSNPGTLRCRRDAEENFRELHRTGTAGGTSQFNASRQKVIIRGNAVELYSKLRALEAACSFSLLLLGSIHRAQFDYSCLAICHSHKTTLHLAQCSSLNWSSSGRDLLPHIESLKSHKSDFVLSFVKIIL